jgi:hypothetical protein
LSSSNDWFGALFLCLRKASEVIFAFAPLIIGALDEGLAEELDDLPYGLGLFFFLKSIEMFHCIGAGVSFVFVIIIVQLKSIKVKKFERNVRMLERGYPVQVFS